MDGLQVRELVVVGVHADAEEETSVAAIDDFMIPELRAAHEVLGPFGVENACVRTSTKLDWYF